ncbi:WhiB family transcriptional regulator [Cryobacterium sp. HLT2-28]|uniref:WhiB family transcriptional regulator n=1 Tax=Cryobacterium sp. HLT2-28 TaxID=1259146 RepID=UPI00106C4CC7|nr:WhiB family transcriptional regulator [Cryobacterium sp. HLT2-28]TFB92776.1 hypothetical protein E3O48_13520 [Cryobacterium sp. HLT2-28]
MTKATDAFARLQFAMFTTAPACQDDDRFVSDDVPAATLAPLCRTCPVFDLCADYAGLERPKGGIWAGNRYRINNSNGEAA